MKKRSIAILIIFIFLSLFISYDVQGIILQDIIEEEIQEGENHNKLKEINDELNIILGDNEIKNGDILDYHEYFLEFKRLYNLLDENHDIYHKDTEKTDDELFQEDLKALGDILNYLGNIDSLSNEIKERIRSLNERGLSNIYEIKDILEEVFLYYKDSGADNEEIYNFEELQEEENIGYIEKNIVETEIGMNDENTYNSILYMEEAESVGEFENIDEEKSLDTSNLIKNAINSQDLLNDDVVEEVSYGEDMNIYNINTESTERVKDDYRVNVSNLEIIKDNDKLKITFKIDNNLDLKKEKNDLKIYIANNKKNNEILITKNKSLEEYLYIEDMASISGSIFKLGKNDALIGGIYTVILSDEEQEDLNSIGLENLVVKVQVTSEDKVNSVVGYLKENSSLENRGENISKEKSEDSLLAIDSDNKNEEKQGGTPNTLPKTGVFLWNYLTLGTGIFMLLLGGMLIRYKKIGS